MASSNSSPGFPEPATVSHLSLSVSYPGSDDCKPLARPDHASVTLSFQAQTHREVKLPVLRLAPNETCNLVRLRRKTARFERLAVEDVFEAIIEGNINSLHELEDPYQEAKGKVSSIKETFGNSPNDPEARAESIRRCALQEIESPNMQQTVGTTVMSNPHSLKHRYALPTKSWLAKATRPLIVDSSIKRLDANISPPRMGDCITPENAETSPSKRSKGRWKSVGREEVRRYQMGFLQEDTKKKASPERKRSRSLTTPKTAKQEDWRQYWTVGKKRIDDETEEVFNIKPDNEAVKISPPNIVHDGTIDGTVDLVLPMTPQKSTSHISSDFEMSPREPVFISPLTQQDGQPEVWDDISIDSYTAPIFIGGTSAGMVFIYFPLDTEFAEWEFTFAITLFPSAEDAAGWQTLAVVDLPLSTEQCIATVINISGPNKKTNVEYDATGALVEGSVLEMSPCGLKGSYQQVNGEPIRIIWRVEKSSTVLQGTDVEVEQFVSVELVNFGESKTEIEVVSVVQIQLLNRNINIFAAEAELQMQIFNIPATTIISLAQGPSESERLIVGSYDTDSRTRSIYLYRVSTELHEPFELCLLFTFLLNTKSESAFLQLPVLVPLGAHSRLVSDRIIISQPILPIWVDFETTPLYRGWQNVERYCSEDLQEFSRRPTGVDKPQGFLVRVGVGSKGEDKLDLASEKYDSDAKDINSEGYMDFELGYFGENAALNSSTEDIDNEFRVIDENFQTYVISIDRERRLLSCEVYIEQFSTTDLLLVQFSHGSWNLDRVVINGIAANGYVTQNCDNISSVWANFPDPDGYFICLYWTKPLCTIYAVSLPFSIDISAVKVALMDHALIIIENGRITACGSVEGSVCFLEDVTKAMLEVFHLPNRLERFSNSTNIRDLAFTPPPDTHDVYELDGVGVHRVEESPNPLFDLSSYS
jgi:hypothetical protein